MFRPRGAHGDHTHVDRVRVVEKKYYKVIQQVLNQKNLRFDAKRNPLPLDSFYHEEMLLVVGTVGVECVSVS